MGDTPPFGQWLIQRRKALGLTQEDLAECLACPGSLNRKPEAGQRLPSQEMSKQLTGLLGVTLNERAAFVQFAWGYLTRDAAKRKLWQTLHTLHSYGVETHPTNIAAPLTSLIGREQEVAGLHSLILEEKLRLVTVTGPPGIGKTRLGLQVALDSASDFREGPLSGPGELLLHTAHTAHMAYTQTQIPVSGRRQVSVPCPSY